MNDYTVPHEMGHVLGLLHLNGPTSSIPLTTNLFTCAPPPQNLSVTAVMKATFPAVGSIGHENVARVSGPDYNADIAGDLVNDTDACFVQFSLNFCRENLGPSLGLNHLNYNVDPRVVDNSGDTNTKCFYCFATSTKYTYILGNTFYTTLQNGISTDVALNSNTWQNIVDTTLSSCTAVDSGVPYNISNSLVHNFMHVSSQTPYAFTPGQGTRIRETLLGNLQAISGPLQNKLNLMEDGTPNIAALYEPFQSFEQQGTATSYAYSRTITPNPTNTGVNVWNCGPFWMHFQTGFDCEFYNLAGQTITQTPFQHYNAICNGFIGIKIPILSNEIIYHGEPVCFATSEPYTSGTLQSLENLGASFYEQEELDQIKVTDPDLYEKLQSGKYHIIKKKTDSGYIDQKVIYKN
ncbi:MAG: hypothetical protein H7174_11165 [Flavobacterium sp.]|nr:hypothetical protein [Flavobacterium sp.]